MIATLDPVTSEITLVRGRVIIGGKTYGAVDPADPTKFLLEQWVELDSAGFPRATTIVGSQPGLGFPGTESPSAYPGLRGRG